MSQPSSVAEPDARAPETRSFNWFLASTFASAVGRNGYHIACAWLLIVWGHGSAAVAGFFAIISLTELVVSPFAGWLADRFDRRALYVAAEIVRVTAASVLGATLFASNVLWMISLSAVLFATSDRIALTASQSMIPTISARYSLATANSMTFFLMQFGSLAAAGLIGILLHAASAPYAFGTIATGFLVSAICMWMLRREKRVLGDSREVRAVSLAIDFQFLCLGAVYALLYTGGMLVSVNGPSFVFDEHGGSAIDFGQLESAWSAGSIVGALLLIPLIRSAKLPALQLVILGLSAVAFVFLKVLNLHAAFAAFALLGTLYNLGRVTLEVMLQSSVSSATLGRAKGVLHSIGVLLGVVLFAVVSVVADDIQPSTIFLGYGAILFVGTVVLIFCHARAARSAT